MIWKVLFSLLGLFSFGFILNSYGWSHLWHDISGLGWWAWPLAFSFVPVGLCYALAWLLVTPELPLSALGFFFRATVVGVAWNNLSPFVKILGEPVKVLLLEQKIPRKAALKSVVIYNLVHVLGTMGAFLVGSTILLFAFPVAPAIRFGFVAVMVVCVLLMASAAVLPHFLKGRPHKRRKRNFFGKIGFWLRWGLSKIRVVTRQYPWRFWSAVGCEVVARFVEGVTFFFAFRALGEPVALYLCALLDVGRALIDNVFFFIPYQVGSREAGILLLTRQVMHIGQESVVTAAVLYRLVEILWAGLGYLVWIKMGNAAKSSK